MRNKFTSYLPCDITDIRCCVIVTCLIWVKCSVPVSCIPANNKKLSPSGEKTGCGTISSHSFSGARSEWFCKVKKTKGQFKLFTKTLNYIRFKWVTEFWRKDWIWVGWRECCMECPNPAPSASHMSQFDTLLKLMGSHKRKGI